MPDPLLDVENLTTHFHTDEGTVRAVDGISFTVDRGETLCIVGESGSGKSVTAESITDIIPTPPGEIVEGSVRFDGRELTALGEKELQEIRGARISHVFQNPQEGLNPVYRVGKQIAEALRLHRDVSRSAARERAVELLDRVGIPEATTWVDDYPHEFSGGMKQRIMVAMALACQPDLLIADEPTTALDVTIQAQILDLLSDLQEEFEMSVIFVTHDLGVVAEIADRVVVMYAGKVMERGDVYQIFEDPAHPYTRALLSCLPGRAGEMQAIEGELPDPTNPPAGCRFYPRCPHSTEDCKQGAQPPLHDAGGQEHVASCVYYGAGYDPADLEDGGWDAGEETAADGGSGDRSSRGGERR